MVEKQCESCKQTFSIPKYREHSVRFCSWECRSKGMSYDFMKGNKFRQGLRPANAFTSDQVREMNRVDDIEFECCECGIKFGIKPWIEKQNKSKWGLRFCSKPCHSAYMKKHFSGENSPQWVGGITTYRGKGWLVARKSAIERDGGKCAKCNRYIGDSIPVHHIIPFRLFIFIEEANHLDNLICLCQSCHMKEERKTDTRLRVQQRKKVKKNQESPAVISQLPIRNTSPRVRSQSTIGQIPLLLQDSYQTP